jgi:hypothetical protein
MKLNNVIKERLLSNNAHTCRIAIKMNCSEHVYYSTPYGYMPCEKCGLPHPREPKIFNMKLAIDQVIEEIEFKKNSITSNSSDDRRAKGAYTDCLMILNKKRDEQISQIVNAVVWFDDTDRRPHQIEEEAKKYLKMTYNI